MVVSGIHSSGWEVAEPWVEVIEEASTMGGALAPAESVSKLVY